MIPKVSDIINPNAIGAQIGARIIHTGASYQPAKRTPKSAADKQSKPHPKRAALISDFVKSFFAFFMVGVMFSPVYTYAASVPVWIVGAIYTPNPDAQAP